MLRYAPTRVTLRASNTSDINPSPTDIQKVGLTEFCIVANKSYKRRKGTQAWHAIQSSPSPSRPPRVQLSLVIESQAPGEPCHWSLYLAREGSSQAGNVYAVTGDAESMTYNPQPGVNVTLSDDFKASYVLAGDVGEVHARILEEVAGSEAPPRARSKAEVVESCQGWCVRVVRKLVERGVLGDDAVANVVPLLEPV